MKIDELNEVLVRHQNIEWQVNEAQDAIQFKNTRLPWYNEKNANGEENATVITTAKLATMSEQELLQAIDKGLDVDQITRVTGYFGKVKGFNPGKIGELNDRVKQTV